MVLKIKKHFKIFHLWSLQIRTQNHWGILHVKLNSMPKGCQIAWIGISSFALFPCTDQKPNKWMSLIKPFRLCYMLEDWNPYLCLYLFYSPSRDLRVSQCSPHCHSYLFICFTTTLLSQEENNWSRFDHRSLGIWTQISMCGCHATAPYRFLDWFHCFYLKKKHCCLLACFNGGNWVASHVWHYNVALKFSQCIFIYCCCLIFFWHGTRYHITICSHTNLPIKVIFQALLQKTHPLRLGNDSPREDLLSWGTKPLSPQIFVCPFFSQSFTSKWRSFFVLTGALSMLSPSCPMI